MQGGLSQPPSLPSLTFLFPSPHAPAGCPADGLSLSLSSGDDGVTLTEPALWWPSAEVAGGGAVVCQAPHPVDLAFYTVGSFLGSVSSLKAGTVVKVILGTRVHLPGERCGIVTEH